MFVFVHVLLLITIIKYFFSSCVYVSIWVYFLFLLNKFYQSMTLWNVLFGGY